MGAGSLRRPPLRVLPAMPHHRHAGVALGDEHIGSRRLFEQVELETPAERVEADRPEPQGRLVDDGDAIAASDLVLRQRRPRRSGMPSVLR